jgi:hypothetical protein
VARLFDAGVNLIWLLGEIVLAGIGICAAVVKRSDSAVGKVLLMDSHLHDFTGMLLVFVSAGYIVMHVPEWSFMVVVGTLVGYYTVLNLYRGTGVGE